MRPLIALAAVLAFITIAGVVHATGGGKSLLYGGAGQGKVIFDGRTHAAKGFRCNDCHLGIFETKKKALITMADHNEGRACFACHDGAQAFKECAGCHRT
jgi:thiosulfate reductase cytochrome b subunit